MFATLFKLLHGSRDDVVALILRFGLAAIFIVHGYIKVYVDIELAPKAMSLDGQRVVGWLELLGGLFLLAGLCTRLAAGVVMVLQFAAIILVTGKYAMEGVRIAQTKSDNYMLVGPEYNFVLIMMCLCLLVLGGGTMSLDRLIGRWWTGKKPEAAPPAPASAAPTPAGGTAVPAPPPGKPTAADKPAGSVPAA